MADIEFDFRNAGEPTCLACGQLLEVDDVGKYSLRVVLVGEFFQESVLNVPLCCWCHEAQTRYWMNRGMASLTEAQRAAVLNVIRQNRAGKRLLPPEGNPT